ncbi:uncharacterized protein XM38_016150 [Halomicronema hongdechloris C2206]|uniref:Uncharacterized protein n=1 Tax=Halomicronema hongdechloris C2206 TaxID=1641165 RepID=A0A1Z3HK35_9CYAN|nr:hypothetical protein [Halomicronema hongdechloris]ASC70670.1 uncharacterized protein XM38_016150 [Halomicronema hongdechloris C2206]
MNPDTVTHAVQKGVRVTLGATATLIEALQDPQGVRERFSSVGTDFNRLAEELESQGVLTEQEARKFVDSVATQMPSPFAQGASSDGATSPSTPSSGPKVDAALQADLAELNQQLTQIREDLEALKQQGPSA